MIYAYCLSVFSIHFFTKHNLSKFKLRLINQQTGDCTDSMILDAQKLTADSFPVAIKLKGGQRLLMKIKLLSLPSKSSEVLVGEGVVNFDRASIDSTLRVPIYDKQKGVEEIAICSIDFFLSGFQVEKHVSINVDKSRSRVQDWRERTEDAIYSQMSYTVESQEERKAEVNSKLTDTIKKQESIKNKTNQYKDKQRQKQQAKSGKKVVQTTQPKKITVSPVSKEKVRQQDDQEKPFALQNSAYLGQKPAKKKFTKKQSNNPSARSNKNNIFAFDSMSNELFKDKQQDQVSPNKQKKNDLMIQKLKKYLQDIEDNSQVDYSPKHSKKRRKNIKVQEYAAYNFQNIFIKYHKDLKSKPTKILRNIKAIRIIKNQIKQDQQGRIIPQIINKLFITSATKQKIISFDALGFRSHCIINNQSQSALSIPVPCEENILKFIVMLNQEGNFQGNFGLQEGEKMNIKLNRIDYDGNQSILQRSQFKLIFDLKAEYIERRSAKLININNDGSFRQPYDILVPELDIKKRVELLSGQPWGFVNSYAKEVNLSEQSKQIINKINKELPQNQLSKLWSLKSKEFNQQNKKIKQKESISESEGQKFIQKPPKFTEQQKLRSRSSKTKEYLENTPIKIKKLKPITPLSSENHEFNQINSIRNGNRNNYKFKDRTTSKQIKQAWQEILFKRKLQQEKLQQKKEQMSRINMGNYTNKKKKKLFDSLNTEIIQNSDSSSLSSNQFNPHKKSNKLYKYSQNEDKQSKFPLRSLKLKISNISITQPQAVIDERQQNQAGKFVKFSILNNVIYFTQVIFNGGYNSILWKLQGCIFEQLTGNEKLQIQIYQTLMNRIKMIGKSQIRISRLFFLRNNHIYNGRIVYNNISNGEFTIGFEIEEYFPFQAIKEEEEDTVHLKKNHSENKNKYKKTKNVDNLTHHSQKSINTTLKRRGLESTLRKDKNEKRYELSGKISQEQLQQSMSMPIGLTKPQQQ